MTFEISITAIGICRAAALILGTGLSFVAGVTLPVVGDKRSAFIVSAAAIFGLGFVFAGVLA